MPLAEITDATREAQDLLRDPEQFKWYAVTLLALVLYVYAVEVERRRWDIVLAGAAFWLADWINEIANALVLHFTDRAPLWSASGETAYLVLIGLTVEISLMFAIGGVIYAKLLPPDRGARILGLPNRLALGLGFSLFAVGVELLLNRTGYFNWEYGWWGTGAGIPAIVILGYLWFYLVAAYVYDLPSDRARLRVVGAMGTAVAVAIIVFGPILEWV